MPTARGSWRRDGRRVSWQGGSGRGSGGRGGGGVGGGRGGGGGEGGGGAGKAVIKSNNPHLAGGEITRIQNLKSDCDFFPIPGICQRTRSTSH